jgi:hypothetical protein
MKSLWSSIVEFYKTLSVVQRVVVAIVLVLIAWDFYVFSPLAAGPKRSAAAYEIGQEIDVSITLVTTDARALACGSPEVVADHHCEFETSKQKWSKTQGKPQPMEILAPYKTTDDRLFLVPDLWREPALAQRLSIDPPNFNQEHARFVANCKLKIEGKIDKIETRWQYNGKWGEATDAWVGTISACLLSDA